MEINRNYTPVNTSFGMAFKKPSPEAMEQFTEFVTKKGKLSPRLAKKGVERIVKQQAGNRHFDMEFSAPKEIILVPKTLKAQEMQAENMLEVNRTLPKNSIDKYREKYLGEAFDSSLDKATGLKKIGMFMKFVGASVKNLIIREMRPEYLLPQNLRLASRNATDLEATVSKQITKEAEEAKIAAKKAAKKSARKEKAFRMIDSAFDSKEAAVKKAPEVDTKA